MLKLILIIILAVITTIVVIIIRSSSAPKKDTPSHDEVDPATLVRMRRAPGVEAPPQFIFPEGEEDVDYTAPSPLDYIDEMPEHFREPSMTDLILDEDVPLEKKQRIAEELYKLGYVISIKEIDSDVSVGVLSESVPQEEGSSFQEENIEIHPELAEPEEAREENPQPEVSPAQMQRWPGVDNGDRLALAMEIQELVNSRMFPPELAEVASRLLETEITIPVEDATQENYDRADLILNTTDVSAYSFDMFSEYCHNAVGKRHIEVEKPKGEEELPGEDYDAPARTTLPSDDMSNDISWGMIEA